MLPPSMEEALMTLSRRLAHTVWRVGGSTALALQGLELTPRDIDLLTPSEEEANRVATALSEFVMSPPRWQEKKPFGSYRGTLSIAGTDVDLIGDLQIRSPDGTLRLGTGSLLWRTRHHINLNGHLIPVAPLEVQLLAYSLMPGRERRVQEIAALLQRQGFDPQILFVFLREQNLPESLVVNLLGERSDHAGRI